MKSGRLHILIDGQFGSTGKGLIASYLGWYNHVDIAVSNASMNAGHTFYIDGRMYVTHHLPITGILNRHSTIYLCSGAIIDPEYLLRELRTFKIDPGRLCVHPRCAIIQAGDRKYEREGSVKKIASTQSGVGAALIRKIDRSSSLAMGCDLLKPYIRELDLNFYLEQGCDVVMEVPQGFDLSINSGLSYPHCTSREVTVEAALSDAQVHPSYLGEVIVVIRTYPIRVGHIVENGEIVGNSGPFYPDSVEVTWEQIGVDPEYTTVTKRERRVATFSFQQYRKMLSRIRPDKVFLNFANYLTDIELEVVLNQLQEVTHVCFGPHLENVKLREEL